MVELNRQGTSLRTIAERMKARGFAISRNAVREITSRTMVA
jgi:hypothetical protein